MQHQRRGRPHDKKPAYFAAGTLPPYDQELQHEREKAGRPADPLGGEHRRWNESVRSALESRRAHLQHVSGRADVSDMADARHTSVSRAQL